MSQLMRRARHQASRRVGSCSRAPGAAERCTCGAVLLWCAWSAASSGGGLAGFVLGGGSSRRSKEVLCQASKAQDVDLDDVIFLPMEEDVSVDDFVLPPQPELKERRKLQGFLDEKQGPGGDAPSKPAKEELDEAASELLNQGALAKIPGKSKGGKKKRWLMGRGSAKRRKLEENSALQKWLLENDVWVSESSDWGVSSSGVSMAVETREMVENEISGRGLIARRDIDIYEDLARVPMKILITKDKALEKFGGDVILGNMSEYAAIALFMIHENYHVGRESSFWGPYLGVLPSTEDVDCSIFWSEEELEMLLDGSPLRNTSLYINYKLRGEFDALRERLERDAPDQYPLDVLTWENYMWAYSNLFSRAVRLNFDDTPDFIAMVPYIDLINHNPPSSTYITGTLEGSELPFGMDTRERYILVQADRYYKQYEQIYISYGPKSNAQLLMLYGFALERNTQDFVEVVVERFLNASSMASEKRELLDRKKIDPTAFPLYRDRFTNEMMQFMRILVIQPEDLKIPETSTEEQRIEAMMQLDVRRAYGELSERRALLCLRGICEELMAGYSTTIDQDEVVLQDRTMFELLPKRQRMATRVKYGEKCILRNTVNTIDRVLNNLGKLTEMQEEEEARERKNSNTFWGRLGIEVEPAIRTVNLEEIMNGLDI